MPEADAGKIEVTGVHAHGSYLRLYVDDRRARCTCPVVTTTVCCRARARSREARGQRKKWAQAARHLHPRSATLLPQVAQTFANAHRSVEAVLSLSV